MRRYLLTRDLNHSPNRHLKEKRYRTAVISFGGGDE
jgi:hypothetical protein